MKLKDKIVNIILNTIIVLFLMVSGSSMGNEKETGLAIASLIIALLIFLAKKKIFALYPKKDFDVSKKIDELNEKLINLEDEIKLKEEDIKLKDEDIKLKETSYEKENLKLIQDYEQRKEKLIEEYNSKEQELKEALAKIDKELVVKFVDSTDYSDINSEQIKNDLSLLKLKQNELIKNGKAVKVDNQLQKRRQNALLKQILKAFNVDFDLALSKLTYSNIDSTRGKIVKSFEMANKIFADDNVEIKHKYLDLKLEELNLVYQYNKKLEMEKENQRAIKEQMIEEDKVRREIEKEKQKIEKEEKQFKNELDKLMKYMSKTDNDVEKNLYIDKIKELEGKLKLVEADKKNVLDRETNTRAGYVYVISNIGSFGNDVYKIGMTRRLEPMDRVKELGSASVPFEFDVHAMIFSEDAPDLENKLHQHFRDKEVNKVNQRKEFFKVNLKEIEKFVKDNFNATVEFTELAKAEQYRESLRLSKKQ